MESIVIPVLILYAVIVGVGMWLLFKLAWFIMRKITIAVYGKTDPWNMLNPKDKEKWK